MTYGKNETFIVAYKWMFGKAPKGEYSEEFIKSVIDGYTENSRKSFWED